MSERPSIIDNDNIKGFFEIYMDNELKGMKVDYGNVKSLYLTSVSTQTETPDESLKIKFQKLLKQNEELEKENLSLKLQNNRLKRNMKKKLKNKASKNKKIKKYAKILGLDIDRLKRCKGDSLHNNLSQYYSRIIS